MAGGAGQNRSGARNAETLRLAEQRRGGVALEAVTALGDLGGAIAPIRAALLRRKNNVHRG